MKRLLWSLLLWPIAAVSVAASPLPCESTEGDCIARLYELAIANNVRVDVLDRAIATRERTLWSEGLPRVNVGQDLLSEGFEDGFSASVSFDLVSLVGGGQRANGKLAIANLQARREEFLTSLRLEIARAVFALERSRSRLASLVQELETRELALALYEVDYAAGVGETVEYFGMSDSVSSVRRQVCEAENTVHLARLELVALVMPQQIGDLMWQGCDRRR